ncbi:MAG: iron hydrogenase small subunit [Eubacteriales bacterium]|nr:iron hydrogenase small subunit [Eubacteriales bacterium]
MQVTINHHVYEFKQPQTILTACASIGIEIPTLCYEKSLGAIASCRVCVVKVVGRRGLVTACNTPIADGMQIITNDAEVTAARKTVLELLLSDHRLECTSCARVDDCRLKRFATQYGADKNTFAPSRPLPPIDKNQKHIVRDNAKCIRCGRCVKVCCDVQGLGVLGTLGRGFDGEIGCAFGESLDTTKCIACGQCVAHCPTGALVENSNLPLLMEKLADPNIHCVVATAPSVRVTLGEGFGLPSGTNVQGKMVAALRRVGFDRVFDLDFAADLTIMQEGHELLERLQSGKNLPQFTSCCPGWVNYVEQCHPELIPNLSTAKSPMGMFGAIVKSYYAKKAGIDPKQIYTVMLMPCIAKCDEITRDAIRDVDMVITSRTAIRFFKQQGVNLAALPDEEFDNPLSLSSGAGLIFGTSGGVCEAAMRNIKDQLPRSIKGIVVSGIANAEKLIQQIKAGQVHYDFIEVMACPGGCVNGGGQPSDRGLIQDNLGNARKRAATIKSMDKYNSLHKASDNPAIQQLYQEFLGSPESPLAQKLLHTRFHSRSK